MIRNTNYMSQHIGSPHTIARNTLMLYIRMFALMLVGLYTSRVVLSALGESDFGIYNVVGGVVSMFTVISGSLNSAISRYITFELGKGTESNLNKVYSTAVTIQFMLVLLIVIVAEPVGLWFISNEMTISPERIGAAEWVFHLSLLSFAVNLMSVPQMAAITAHEKMSAYAWIGVLDGVLRLAVALLIQHSAYDRLIFYAVLMCAVVIIVRICYLMYCRFSFPECRYRPVFDFSLIKEMFSFAGWSFIGAASGVFRDHGGNILVNLFSGPAVNAARGVALQLNGAVQGFVTNFMTAVNPQITKSYAAGDHAYMFSLIRKSSRMSFYLLYILALPVIIYADNILDVWLKEVPGHSVLFVRLFLVFALSESISSPLITAQLATGKIRDYQLVVGGIQFLNVPVSYLFLKMGYMPEVTVVVAIVISQMCLYARLFMLEKMIGLSFRQFFVRVCLNVSAVVSVSLPVTLCAVYMLPDSSAGFLAGVAFSIVITAMSVLFVGCSRGERRMIVEFLKERIG